MGNILVYNFRCLYMCTPPPPHLTEYHFITWSLHSATSQTITFLEKGLVAQPGQVGSGVRCRISQLRIP